MTLISAVIEPRRDGDVLVFSNEHWLLEVATQPMLNPRLLVHAPTGRIVADQDYCYRVDLAPAQGSSGFSGGAQRAQRAQLIDWQRRDDPGRATVVLTARLDFGARGPTDIIVEHAFTLFDGFARLDERLALVHRFGRDSHTVSDFRFGFRKRLFDGESKGWVDDADSFRLAPVPFRRRRGQAQDFLLEEYPATDIVPASWGEAKLPGRPAEGWGWHDGSAGILISKYSQEHIEFGLADGEFYSGQRTAPEGHDDHVDVGDVCLRFGGAGRANGAPGVPIVLDPTRPEFRFGVSTIETFVGGWEAGHLAYARLMRERGHVVPPDYDPPVHWNELFALSWRGGTNAPLQEPDALWGQARIASLAGAEAFYLDPGWDTFEGSSIWDDERLGSLESFVDRLRDEFGLRMSLHLMMHTKSLTEDPRIYRRGRDGEVVLWAGDYTGGHVCPGSAVWRDQKTERLLVLARAGVTFLMFDFVEYPLEGTRSGVASQNTTACWAPDHGHTVPMTLEEHSAGVVEVMRRVKREYPEVLIEAHDRISSGVQDYLPLYYEHALPEPTFDEHWGFEYMWNPYMDLLSGKALSLYEYNLAYDIPLYLHINLAFDNRRALAFWWFASTCRHLGIGGIAPGDDTWDSHLEAMATYLRLKPHFARGRFVGLGRTVHAHVLDDECSAVIVAFNLSSSAATLDLALDAALLGLPEGAVVEGADVEVRDGVGLLAAPIDALSPHVFTLEWKQDQQ